MVRKRAWTPVVLLLAFGGMTSSAPAQQIIVGYDHTVSHHSLQSQPGVKKVVKRMNRGQVAVLNVADADAKKIVAQLQDQPGVRYAEIDQKLYPSTTPNDTLWSGLWGMANIGLPDAWTQSTGAEGSGVVVAVTDSGIQLDHPDLVNQLWTNPDETDGNDTDDDGNGLADDIHGADYYANDGTPNDVGGHGTHVSGTIGAERDNSEGVAGVAPASKIMALRFIGPMGGYTSGAVSAIDYAIAKGAKVINASWGGGGYSSALSDAITRAKNANILFVAAAGNSTKNLDKAPDYPSSYVQDNILVVVALDSSNALAGFSNYGAKSADIGAPGVAINSTYLSSGYTELQGTSMAAPHVAGAAAALWSKEPGATYLQIKNALIAGGTTTASVAGKTTSGKRLNLASAFTQLDLAINGPQSVIPPNLQWSSGKLLCGTGTWNPTTKMLTYTWRKNDVPITGANKNVYVVPSGDLASSFVCEVGAAVVKGGATRVAQSRAVVPNNPPPLAGAVKITGFNGMDGLLTCDKGTWMYGNITYDYQWYRDGESIGDANTSTYTIGSADRNHILSCSVVGTNEVDSTAGISGSLAVKWTDDAVAPTAPVVGTIPALNNKASFAVAFKGEKNARFYCSFDESEYSLCANPAVFTGITEGSHSLSVKQKDQAGNMGPASTTQTWTTDLTAPSAATAGYNFDTSAASAVGGALPATTANTAIAFFPSAEEGATLQCSLNSTKLGVCSTKQVYSGLKKGLQTFRLQQTDAAGNTSPLTTITWTVI